VDPNTGGAAEFGFFEGVFLGPVLKHTSGAGSGGGNRGLDTAQIIKEVLTCPSANHDNDPDADQAAAAALKSVYFGDYIYNSWMGTTKRGANAGDPDIITHFNPKITEVPGNVIILMESRKPNVVKDSSGVFIANPNWEDGNAKYYFEKNNEIWTTVTSAGQPASVLKPLRIGTPHRKNKLMNVLSADGHVSLVDPYKDFFADPKDQGTVKQYLWYAKDEQHTGWRKGAPGI
jgi:hypothetical protein